MAAMVLDIDHTDGDDKVIALHFGGHSIVLNKSTVTLTASGPDGVTTLTMTPTDITIAGPVPQ